MTNARPSPRANPILAKFRAALAEIYCDRLERVVLSGSRARGDAQPDSDYDVAVFLKGMDGPSDRWAELHKLADPCVKFIDETGTFFEAKPYPAGAYRLPLAAHARNPARGASPVFERTGGKVVKTHKGVNLEFLRLPKDDPAFTPDQGGFLSRA